MRVLLILLLLAIFIGDVFDDLSLGAGLSVKNLVLGLALVVLGLRQAVHRDLRLEPPGIFGCFFLLVVYAVCSWLVASFIIRYDGYSAVARALELKASLIDHLLFFGVFFFGARTEKDGRFLLYALLVLVILLHLITIAASLGLTPPGFVEERETGRIEGTLGEANQYAGFVAAFLPAIIGAALATRGVPRLMWFGATLISTIALILPASRGALLGMVFAIGLGTYLFRRQLSLTQLAKGALSLVALVAISIAGAAWRYGSLLKERLIRESMVVDTTSASSGRLDVWAAAAETMMSQPVTLLTGFGWNTFWIFPFSDSPHNTYLAYWFNLGLIGLTCFVCIFGLCIMTARASVTVAPQGLRPHLMAFPYGMLACLGALFFVEFYEPWAYIWAYCGIIMRLAVIVRSPAVSTEEGSPSTQARATIAHRPLIAADRHGWTARRQRS